ncbi:MAG: PKD domain-containing protein, partial [Fuerstiella sp.]|nr:PKD domain-containing protein [Fuerstiella sp.]
MSDDDGSVSNPKTFLVTVHNVAPIVTIDGPTAAIENQQLTFTVEASDAGSADQMAGFAYNIDFGDGTNTQVARVPGNDSGITVTHLFQTAGSYTVSATATDIDGGISTTFSHAVDVSEITAEGLQDVVAEMIDNGEDPAVTIETTANSDLGAVISSASQLAVDSVTIDIVV